MMRNNPSQPWRKAPSISTIVLVTAFTLALLPLIWTLLAALGVQADASTTPPRWSLPPQFDAFMQVREEQTYFWAQMVNTIAASLLTTVCALVAGFMAAFSLAHLPTRGRQRIAQGLLILACLPVITYVIPLRELLRAVRLQDTFVGLVWAQTALFSPLAAYILYGYLMTTSPDLEDAARLDGATMWGYMWRVAVPIHAMGLLAIGVIVFVLSYNQFIMPLMLTDTNLRIMPVSMRDFFSLEREFEWQTGAAVIVATLLPALLAVGLAHRALDRFSLHSSVAD